MRNESTQRERAEQAERQVETLTQERHQRDAKLLDDISDVLRHRRANWKQSVSASVGYQLLVRAADELERWRIAYVMDVAATQITAEARADGWKAMSKMSEREIAVSNGDACPKCWHVYPAPTANVESVTCGACGFVNQIAPETMNLMKSNITLVNQKLLSLRNQFNRLGVSEATCHDEAGWQELRDDADILKATIEDICGEIQEIADGQRARGER